MSNLKHAIEVYKTEKKVFPKDWESMESFGFKSTLAEVREILDAENRYIFPNIEKIFKSPTSSGKRIVLMAKRSGKEGNVKIYEDDSASRAIEGRFVIFERVDNGGIESGRISEEVLKSMFKSEGLNLADFTFEEPPKAEPKAYHLPDSIRRPGDSVHLGERSTSRPEKRMKNTSPIDMTSEDSPLMSHWKWMVFTVVLFFVMFFVVKRIKPAR